MTIEEKVRGIIAEYFSGFSYVFEDWQTADKKIDKVALPAVIHIVPVSGTFDFGRHGRIRDAEVSIIAFVDKVCKEADGKDNAEVYNSMKNMAIEFIKKCNESGFFEPIEGTVTYYPLYEQLASIVSGVMVSLTLKELVGRC